MPYLFCALLAFLLCSVSVVSQAGDTDVRLSEHTATAIVRLPVTVADWDITEREWQQFQRIMSGPRGRWTPNADPLLVLGVHASTASERRRFAERHVQQEFERASGELAFQREVSAAWQRLYGDVPLFANRSLSTHRPASTLTKPSTRANRGAKPVRYALVVAEDCVACDETLRHYLQRVNSDSSVRALDVYVRDTRDDDATLRAWVAAKGVDPALVRGHRVTINHGGRYHDTEVPAVWSLSEEGQWVNVQ